MRPPTSRYGCGNDECEACYGDIEWQRANCPDFDADADDDSDELGDPRNPMRLPYYGTGVFG